MFPSHSYNLLFRHGKAKVQLSHNSIRQQVILLNDFTCRETRLHNADWFNRMITLGSIQRYAVYVLFFALTKKILISCIGYFCSQKRLIVQISFSFTSLSMETFKIPLSCIRF